MSTSKTLKASGLTADSRKGRQATDLFRDAYNAVALDEECGQHFNENPAVAPALRELIRHYSMPISAPEGGRIHVVRVPVNQGREWQEAIDAAGPNTGKDWNIRKVSEHYPPQEGQVEEREVILVNFGKTIQNGQYALNWATQFGLKPSDPRKVFAVGEHKLELHKELDVDAMAVVSLVPCAFEGGQRVPFSWWDGS